MGTLQPNQNITSVDSLLSSLPSGSYERVEKQIVKNAASLRAINDPLPGPMADALFNEPIQVETSVDIVHVRKMVVYDVTLFKKFNSPFYRQLLESQKETPDKEDTEYTDEESFEMVFQFINDPLVVKRTADKGRQYFTDKAVEEVALKYNLSDIKLIVDAITIQIMRAFQTLIPHGVEEGDKLDSLVSKYAKSDEEREYAEQHKKK